MENQSIRWVDSRSLSSEWHHWVSLLIKSSFFLEELWLCVCCVCSCERGFWQLTAQQMKPLRAPETWASSQDITQQQQTIASQDKESFVTAAALTNSKHCGIKLARMLLPHVTLQELSHLRVSLLGNLLYLTNTFMDMFRKGSQTPRSCTAICNGNWTLKGFALGWQTAILSPKENRLLLEIINAFFPLLIIHFILCLEYCVHPVFHTHSHQESVQLNKPYWWGTWWAFSGCFAWKAVERLPFKKVFLAQTLKQLLTPACVCVCVCVCAVPWMACLEKRSWVNWDSIFMIHEAIMDQKRSTSLTALEALNET